jgi:hypothetical protein
MLTSIDHARDVNLYFVRGIESNQLSSHYHHELRKLITGAGRPLKVNFGETLELFGGVYVFL